MFQPIKYYSKKVDVHFFKILFVAFFLFTIKATGQPTITSFTPTSGPVGTMVTITGTNFNTTPANNIVYFGAVKAKVISSSANNLTVTAPAGATSKPITVLDTITGLISYSSKPYITTFANPFIAGIPANFYNTKVDFTTGSNPRLVEIVDIDGDGKPDIATLNITSKSISIFRNISSPGSILPSSFNNKIDIITADKPNFFTFADIDGDGKPDLIVTNSFPRIVSIFRNLSTADSITAFSFAPRVDFAITGNEHSVAIADLDGDGKPDLAITNSSGDNSFNTISVLKNATVKGVIDNTSFAPKVDFVSGASPSSLAIADLDGDGKVDLAATSYLNTISILRNTSTSGVINSTSFAPKIDFTTGNYPGSIVSQDLDGNNQIDLTVVNQNSNTVSILRNTSIPGSINASSFAGKVDLPTNNLPISVAIGDLNGDGKPDLVIINYLSNNISVLRNTSGLGNINSSSFSNKVDFTTGINPFSVAIGDLDGDGIPEIVAANDGSNNISIFQIAIFPTTILLASSVNPATVGQSITFTATLTASGSPTGTVTFYDSTSNTSLGTVQLAGNAASISTSTLTAGSHKITATYSGSAGFAASTSTVLVQAIIKQPTTISLASSANTATVGQSITFTATLTASASPTGTVTFYDSTANTSLGSVQLAGNTASVSTSALTAGSHNITATYSGSAGYAASTSIILSQVVQPALTPAIVVYPNPVKNGSMQLHFINMPAGNYFVRLINSLGQTIVSRQINYAGGTGIQTIMVNKIKGVYILETVKPGNSRQINKIIIN